MAINISKEQDNSSRIINIYVTQEKIKLATAMYVIVKFDFLNASILVPQKMVHETKDKLKVSVGIVPNFTYNQKKSGVDSKTTGEHIIKKYFDDINLKKGVGDTNA